MNICNPNIFLQLLNVSLVNKLKKKKERKKEGNVDKHLSLFLKKNLEYIHINFNICLERQIHIINKHKHFPPISNQYILSKIPTMEKKKIVNFFKIKKL